VREIRRYNREMQGYSTGSGTSNNGGPINKMEVSDNDTEAGCCKCVVM
jgi:GTPase KRas